MNKGNGKIQITETDNSNNIIMQAPQTADIENRQIDLFKGFLCNLGDRDNLSNTFDLWDSVPRYTISRLQMDKWRKSGEFPNIIKMEFQHRGTQYKASIQASWIETGEKQTMGYFPSANEELVEDALRKIAAEEKNGFFDKPNYRSGVIFTLHMLRKELKKRGHTRSYQQIVLSLQILAKSTIEIVADNGKKGKRIAISNYFPTLNVASKDVLESDPDAKWMVQFHPLVTQEIDLVTYRQFNYSQMMSYSTQLARWLHKQLSLKFTFASMVNVFEIRFSTVKRDSGLLENYAKSSAAIEALNNAFKELIEKVLILSVDKVVILGKRKKIEDVIYRLTPSPEFCSEMKVANKRKILADNKVEDAVVIGGGTR